MEEISKGIKVIKALKRLKDKIHQKMGNKFKQMNITGPQGMLMGILTHYGEMKISDLSEKLGLSNSTVSGIIDRLEKQGLVERVRSKDDRRVIFVNVTPELRKSAQEHFNQIDKTFEEIMNKATPEELDKILAGLDILEKVMERK